MDDEKRTSAGACILRNSWRGTHVLAHTIGRCGTQHGVHASPPPTNESTARVARATMSDARRRAAGVPQEEPSAAANSKAPISVIQADGRAPKGRAAPAMAADEPFEAPNSPWLPEVLLCRLGSLLSAAMATLCASALAQYLWRCSAVQSIWGSMVVTYGVFLQVR